MLGGTLLSRYRLRSGPFPLREALWSLAKLWLFRLDAERVHQWSVRLVRALGTFCPWLLNLASGTPLWRARAPKARLAHLDILHPVGLAAGFDKNVELLPYLWRLGFAYAEIGTVTPRPQAGNALPRLFRDAKRKALFNRMGFNNDGADIVAERLERVRKKLPPGFVVGVNIGKNKDTPAENAADDYRLLARRFRDLADYLVINVSSPNTPGLRALQSVAALEPIVKNVLIEARSRSERPLPVFLKLAPEVEGEELKDLIEALDAWGISGFVLTNTLGGVYRGEAGGWSGAPVREHALRSLMTARSATRLPIISVGGIFTADDARERLEAGAQAVQLYTGWVYGGPTAVNAIVKGL